MITATHAWSGEADIPDPSTRQPEYAETLKGVYAKYFAVGVAIPGPELREPGRRLVFAHFTAITPENCMKPQPVHPAEDRYDFAKADALMEMAQSNGLTVNGHTLVWDRQCPDWFFQDGDQPASRDLVLKRMREHIATVVGRYAGKVASWDVVNEGLADGNDGYIKQTRWSTAIGDDYIAEAFAAAHAADPQAELYYNDYNIEGPAKRARTIRLIRELKARQLPIAGVGIQGHWPLDHIPFKQIEEAIEAFHAEGVKVMITELDVDVVPPKAGGAAGDASAAAADPYVNGLPPDVQQRLAEQYAQLFALFLKHADAVTRVAFWGLHDGRSWLNNYPTKRTNHPLLWDRKLQAKPALAAVLAVPAAVEKEKENAGKAK